MERECLYSLTYNYCLAYPLLTQAQDETRVRYGITKVEPVDFVKEAQYMRDKLQSEWGAEI